MPAIDRGQTNRRRRSQIPIVLASKYRYSARASWGSPEQAPAPATGPRAPKKAPRRRRARSGLTPARAPSSNGASVPGALARALAERARRNWQLGRVVGAASISQDRMGKGRGRGGDGESLRRRAVPAPPSSDDEADGGGGGTERPRLRLKIRGQGVDVTDFQHPGGDVIAHYSDGQDATDAFETFHNRSRKAERTLAALPKAHVPADVFDVAGSGTAKETARNAAGAARLDRAGEAINDDLSKLREELRAEGSFDLHPYPWLHMFCVYILHDLALLALSLALVGSGWAAAGMIMRAFAHVQRGGTMHDLGHNEELSKSRASDLAFTVFTAVAMGFCAHEWRHKHNRHHTSPNMETLDGNVSQLPLFGWNRGWTKRMTRRMQSVQLALWYAAIPLLGLVMQLRGLAWARKWRLNDEVWLMLLHFALDYTAFGYLLAVQPGMTAGAMLGYYALSQSVAGLYIHVIFMYNHQQLPMQSKVLPGATPQQGEAPLPALLRDPCFARLQVMTSANYAPHALMTYLTLGLNFQIEHHLFPEIPRRNLRKISARVQAFCKRHDLPYRVVGHWEAMKEMSAVLRDAADIDDGFPWMSHLLAEHLDCMAD